MNTPPPKIPSPTKRASKRPGATSEDDFENPPPSAKEALLENDSPTTSIDGSVFPPTPTPSIYDSRTGSDVPETPSVTASLHVGLSRSNPKPLRQMWYTQQLHCFRKRHKSRLEQKTVATEAMYRLLPTETCHLKFHLVNFLTMSM